MREPRSPERFLPSSKMSAASNVAIGARVWVEDPELAWLEGVVIEFDGKKVKVRTTKGDEVSTNVTSVHAKDPDARHEGVDDMTRLAYLHEPGVLHNLASRYELDEIYTYTGNILIAVNPFVRLPHLYSNNMMEQYREAPLRDLRPHVFAIADASYRAMVTEKRSQSILVSGESGAGKTETAKLIMQYLAYIGGRLNTDGRTIEKQVLECNPLLEAFGNAKTVHNDNSSRFGKFMEIHFNRSGQISGAAVRTYLLEKSRVVQIAGPERNYHCFYQLCASPQDCERYKLGDPRSFHYLNQSDCFELNGVNNACEFLKTRRAMDVVGIRPEEQEAAFRIVAAVLHLGNVEFVPGADTDSSKVKDEKSKFHLETAAELLRCEAKGLLDSLCTRVLVTRDGNITTMLNVDTATVNRDTLAKTIYSRLFDWLVDNVNRSIGQDSESPFLVGILDIYGFQSFKSNSFEQFCINLANEKLQQYLNQHVFKMEQEEYSTEADNDSDFAFVDNQDVLDLIEKYEDLLSFCGSRFVMQKPSGIIALLDEACLFPKSTNETFATKLFQQYRNHKRLSKPKLGRTDFTINHYAGDVTYQTEMFLDKNKNDFVAEHQSLLGSSACPIVSSLYHRSHDEGSNSPYKFPSIGTRFKHQLQALMDTLNTMEPQYVRCVKPNMLNKPHQFENQNVIQQLRCGGVLEAIRGSCAGYPTRRTFYEFLDRFGLLALETMDANEEGGGGGGEAAPKEQRVTEWPGCSCRCKLSGEYEIQEEGDEEDGEEAENHQNNHHHLKHHQISGNVVSTKEPCQTLSRQVLVPSNKALLFLETVDGELGEVEREVALLSPFVQREVLRHGRGGARNVPIVLPKQVSPGALNMILDYCRFHRVPGRSDKERKVFDEKFVRLDTRRLCELTSAADSLDMKPLGDLTSRALARMIEGKTPEQIREIFHLPDDLTEEEKLEPVKVSTDDPRIRLLNRLYARKRKELQEKKLLKSGATDTIEKQLEDERSVEDLVSFIDGENKNNRLGKGKRKKNRRKKGQGDDSATMVSRLQTDSTDEGVEEKPEHDSTVRGAGRSIPHAKAASSTPLEHHNRLLRDQEKVFEEGDFDNDDGLDPVLKEIVDREVEDFARRLNSNWLKRTQEFLTLASSSHEHRHEDERVLGSNLGDAGIVDSIYLGNRSNGNFICNVAEDNRILQQQDKNM